MTKNALITDYKIEVLNKDSFDAIEKIILESGLINSCTTDNYNDSSIDLLKTKFLKNEVEVFIVRVERQIVGFSILLLKPRALSKINYDWQLAYIYVDLNFRSNKLGENMLRYVLKYAANSKANQFTLCTTSANYEAIELYRKLKFRETKFIGNYTSFTLDLNQIRDKKNLS